MCSDRQTFWLIENLVFLNRPLRHDSLDLLNASKTLNCLPTKYYNTNEPAKLYTTLRVNS